MTFDDLGEELFEPTTAYPNKERLRNCVLPMKLGYKEEWKTSSGFTQGLLPRPETVLEILWYP
jgi:hypothetical protein